MKITRNKWKNLFDALKSKRLGRLSLRKDIGKKSVYTARVQDSKRNPEMVNKEFDFLTIDNGKVTWESITGLQEGTLWGEKNAILLW